MPFFVDTHCHIEMKEFDPDRSEVMRRAREAGIEAMITIGSDLNGTLEGVDLAELHDFIYSSVGIHPHEAECAASVRGTLGVMRSDTTLFPTSPVVASAFNDTVVVSNTVESVTDRAQPSTVKIGWAADCRKAVLLINDYPHAVFDFEAQQGYCRSGFPPPGVGPWSQDGHVWDEACIALFA